MIRVVFDCNTELLVWLDDETVVVDATDTVDEIAVAVESNDLALYQMIDSRYLQEKGI